jgi:hypothetical protein
VTQAVVLVPRAVNWSAGRKGLCPSASDTVTVKTPVAPCGGLTADIDPSACTTKAVAGVPPKLTPVVPPGFTPLRVMAVPPPTGPLAREMLWTIGSRVSVAWTAPIELPNRAAPLSAPV